MGDNTTLEKPLTTNPKLDLASKENVLNRLASGETQQSIAEDHNITQRAVSTIKTNNKALVEAKKQELIKALPSVIDTVKTDINTNNRLSKHIALDFTSVTPEIISLKTTLDKTNVNMLKITGIIQPHTNLINQGNITVNTLNNIKPSITKLIGVASLDKLQAIDIEQLNDNPNDQQNVDNS